MVALLSVCSHSPQDFAEQELPSRQASSHDSKTPEERGPLASRGRLFLWLLVTLWWLSLVILCQNTWYTFPRGRNHTAVRSCLFLPFDKLNRLTSLNYWDPQPSNHVWFKVIFKTQTMKQWIVSQHGVHPSHKERSPHFCCLVLSLHGQAPGQIHCCGLSHWDFLPDMTPKSFSDHLFWGLKDAPCWHGHIYLVDIFPCSRTICFQLSYKKISENDQLTEHSRSCCAGPNLIIFNTLTIFVSSENCVRIKCIHSPSAE